MVNGFPNENAHIFVHSKMSEFLEKLLLSGAVKHPDFQGQVDRGNFTLGNPNLSLKPNDFSLQATPETLSIRFTNSLSGRTKKSIGHVTILGPRYGRISSVWICCSHLVLEHQVRRDRAESIGSECHLFRLLHRLE
jgi:hypothetical protein